MMMKLADCAFIVVDLQEKLIAQIHDADQVLSNSAWLNKLAQRLNVPTIACEQYPKGLAKTHPQILDILVQSNVIEKIHFSAAGCVEFLDKLAALDKSQVVICGIEAHVCVLQTALDLKQMDYEVFVVADAIGSRSSYDKKIALKRMQDNGISIVTKEMVLFEWLQKAGSDLFKNISKEFLK